MNASTKKCVIATIVVCAILIVGELYAYIPNDRYDSSVSLNGNLVSYEVSSSRPVQHSVILLDNTDYQAIDTLYIYRDSGYKVYMSESDMSYFYERLEPTLNVKGFHNIIYVDTDGLYSLLGNDPIGKGMLLPTGAIPILTNPGDDINKLLSWISNGGSLYWSYGIIGSKISYPDRIENADYYNILINDGVKFVGNKSANKEDEYGARLLFSLEQSCIDNSPICSTITADCKGFGFNDGNGYAVTSIQKEKGQITIFGGTIDRLDSKQLRDISTIIGSGLSVFTDMHKIQSNTGSFNGKLNGSFDITDYNQNTVVYINLGGNYSVYSARHVVR